MDEQNNDEAALVLSECAEILEEGAADSGGWRGEALRRAAAHLSALSAAVEEGDEGRALALCPDIER